MKSLPFTVTIPPEEVDPNLADNLQEEWPGILAWMIRGCLSWQHAGLAPPAAVIDATEDYLANEDKVGQFLASVCNIEANGKISCRELLEDWEEWSRDNNCFTGSARLFAGWMEDRQYLKRHTDKGNYFLGLSYRHGLGASLPKPPAAKGGGLKGPRLQSMRERSENAI